MHILQHVTCPPDRGDKAYSGRIVHVGEEAEHLGRKFRWLTVQRNDTGTKHVWPSHRLGL